jgi:hypothetical protein
MKFKKIKLDCLARIPKSQKKTRNRTRKYTITYAKTKQVKVWEGDAHAQRGMAKHGGRDTAMAMGDGERAE